MVCRYLSRLLLLHGRWNYMRNKEVVLYSFYKNWAYVLVYVYLQFVAGELGCRVSPGITCCLRMVYASHVPLVAPA
jgi:magnesium-transporting ATPase (P-type)